MRVRLLHLLPLVGLLLLSACGDAPTLSGAGKTPDRTSVVVLPDGDQQSPSCCDTLRVVAPGPETCDPYLSLDWCQGGDPCITSAAEDFQSLSGCPGAGGSTGGGGGLTCPTWDPACVPGGPGGGSPGTPPDESTACDPSIDPDCYKPLTGADSTTISTALSQYLRSPSAIPDTTARQQCENMINAFNTLYTNGRIFRGAYTTESGDVGIVPHTGAYDRNTGKMHIDPAYLDRAARGDAAALRELMDTLLHESAHALYFDHPNGFVTTPWGPVYSDPYFDLLGPGENSCLVW